MGKWANAYNKICWHYDNMYFVRGKHINVSVCEGVKYHGGSQMIYTDMILIQIICDIWDIFAS